MYLQEDGWKFITQDDVTELYDKYQVDERPPLV